MKSALKYLKDGPKPKAQDEDYLETYDSDEEESDQSDIENQPEYEVEQVIDKRVIKGKLQYFLKWVGYDPTHNTWEPIDVMCCPDLVQEFERKYNKFYDVSYVDVFGHYGKDNNLSERSRLSNDSGIAFTDYEEEDDDEEDKNEEEDNESWDDMSDQSDKSIEIGDQELEAIDSDQEFEAQSKGSQEVQSDNETFKEPETDDEGNQSDISYDFHSEPTIWDIDISDSDEEEDIHQEKTLPLQEFSNNDETVCQTPSDGPVVPPSTVKVPEVLSIDDSDEKITIYDPPGVTPLPFRRPNYTKLGRRRRFSKMPVLIVISDSEEESDINTTNSQTSNQTLETSVENIMESIIAKTVDDINGNEVEKNCDKQVVNNEKAISIDIVVNDEDSDQSEGELVIDLNNTDIENILGTGLVVDTTPQVEIP